MTIPRTAKGLSSQSTLSLCSLLLDNLNLIQLQILPDLSPTMVRKKSLLIGINYTGSQNELRGCHQDIENVAEFLAYRGFSSDPRSQVILRDDAPGPYYPTGHNILVVLA